MKAGAVAGIVPGLGTGDCGGFGAVFYQYYGVVGSGLRGHGADFADLSGVFADDGVNSVHAGFCGAGGVGVGVCGVGCGAGVWGVVDVPAQGFAGGSEDWGERRGRGQ